jgi:hypothetical protein
MANPQIAIIELPLDTDISGSLALEFIPIESTAEGGRRISVLNYFNSAASTIFVPRITSTDRAIATFNSTTGGLRNNPNATVDSSGIITAAGYGSTSSRRYKENITRIYSGLSIINNLQGVRYTDIGAVPRPDGKMDWKFGVIAEDVYWAAPEVVKLNENHQPDAVDYSRIVPLLIEAVNELTKRVFELENKK